MPPRKSFSHLEFFGEISLPNLLDWLVTLVLCALLAISTLQLGGARSETQLLLLWLVCLLLVLHVLWVLVPKRTKNTKLQVPALLIVPFVFYVIFSWLVLTPTPWSGRSEALLVLQGFVIMWVVVHNLRSRNQLWVILLCLGGVGFLSVLMAYNQYFRAPEWLPKLFNPLEGRSFKLTGHEQYAGRASGPFGAPNSFAGFMLLAFFPAAVIAMTKNLQPILRVFSGYLALMFISGLFMTISRGAIAIFLVGLLFLPWFCGYTKKRASLLSVLFFTLCLAGTVVLVFTSARFQERLNDMRLDGGEQTRPAMWEAAWQLFQEEPILGNGLGSYRYLLDQHRPEGFLDSPQHVHNDYLEMASELGVVGLLLFLAPFLWLGWRAFATLRTMPKSIRINDMGRNRRRPRIVPAERLFLGFSLLSLMAFSLHLLFEFHVHLPGLLFWAAFFVGVLIKVMPEFCLDLKGALPRLVYVAGLGALGLLLPVLASTGYIADSYTFEGQRLTKAFAREFKERRADASFHEKRIQVLRDAVKINPRQAEAQSLLALALADSSYVQPTERVSIGQEAETHARIAVEAMPEYPLFHVHLGETLFLQERWAEAGTAYRSAVELSPNNHLAWYYYANWLNGEPDRRNEALTAIDRCLALDPHDERAKNLRRKILIP